MVEKQNTPTRDAILEKAKSQYLRFGDDFEALINGTSMDDYTKFQLLGELDRVKREIDPQVIHEEMSNLFGAVKNRYGFDVGIQLYGDKFSNLPRDKQFQLYTSLGTSDLEELLSPGSQKRRRR